MTSHRSELELQVRPERQIPPSRSNLHVAAAFDVFRIRCAPDSYVFGDRREVVRRVTEPPPCLSDRGVGVRRTDPIEQFPSLRRGAPAHRAKHRQLEVIQCGHRFAGHRPCPSAQILVDATSGTETPGFPRCLDQSAELTHMPHAALTEPASATRRKINWSRASGAPSGPPTPLVGSGPVRTFCV